MCISHQETATPTSIAATFTTTCESNLLWETIFFFQHSCLNVNPAQDRALAWDTYNVGGTGLRTVGGQQGGLRTGGVE